MLIADFVVCVVRVPGQGYSGQGVRACAVESPC